MRTEVHQAEVKHKAKRNDRALYKIADTACKNFILEVVDETWNKELKDTDTLYTNVTDIKLLYHLTNFWSGLLPVNAVYILQLMKTLFTDADGILQFINAMETAQQNSKRAKLLIQDKYMHTVALKLLLKSGEFEAETREWLKLPYEHQIWTAWKTTFMEAYLAKIRAEAARELEDKPFGGPVANNANEQLRRIGNIASDVPPHCQIRC